MRESEFSYGFYKVELLGGSIKQISLFE